MSKHIRHIRADNDEWVQVHRDTPPPSSGEDWLWLLLCKVGGGILGLVIVGQILKAVMPFIVLGALGWVGLYSLRQRGEAMSMLCFRNAHSALRTFHFPFRNPQSAIRN